MLIEYRLDIAYNYNSNRCFVNINLIQKNDVVGKNIYERGDNMEFFPELLKFENGEQVTKENWQTRLAQLYEFYQKNYK